MWRNDGGSSPKWYELVTSYQELYELLIYCELYFRYLERMVVRDLETSECCFFMCGKWFSEVDVEYTFPVATIDQLQISTNLFLLKLENHFKDRFVDKRFHHAVPVNYLIIYHFQTRLVFCFWHEAMAT